MTSQRSQKLIMGLAGLASVLLTPAQAGLLGYWNFDGPATVVQGTDSATARQADTSNRLKDLSGNNYHGNDRNILNLATRVLFNNNDVPRAPFLAPPGNNNYCLDLTGANRYVTMEGATGIAASGAVTTAGDAFNIGKSSAAVVNVADARLTCSFWWKGVSPNNWGDAVAKGGENYTPKGLQGWSVRRNNNTGRFAFTARGIFGDSEAGSDYTSRSGGTLSAPLFNNLAISDTNGQIYSDNIANGMWQHITCVYDGKWLHHYLNGLQVRSQVPTSANYIGTTSLLSFGQNMIADTNAVYATARYGQMRLDEISIWDEALTPAQIEDLARGADPRLKLRDVVRPFDFAWPQPSKAQQATFSISPLATQNAAAATDNNPATDYVNLAGRYSGIIATATPATAVQSFIITTASTLPGRDPTSYEIYGTNGALTSGDNSGGRQGGTEVWTLLSTGSLALPSDRSTDGPVVSFTNATTYASYKVIFPTLASEAVMQISGIRFFPTTDGTGTATTLAASPRGIAESTLPSGLSQSPGQEGVRKALDSTNSTKYLNFAGATSGLIVTPGASVVQSFKITTPNDGPGRDPTSYMLYGTNDAVMSQFNSDGNAENWTLISSGRLNPPVGRLTIGPVIPVTNATSYTSYKLVFPTTAAGTDGLFQIADLYLYQAADGSSPNLLSVTTPVLAISSHEMTSNSAGSYMSGYRTGSVLPQGDTGSFGLFEMRVNGSLRRQEGTSAGTNGSIYGNGCAPLYARYGTATQFQGLIGVTANYPYARSTTATGIDFGDDNASLATGFNGIQTEFLTSVVGVGHDNFFQMNQGCFQVAAPGRYTFTMKGDDGSQLQILGAKWVARYADNGNGSFVDTALQNGFPTGDTNVIGVVEFPAAGTYNFRHVFTEQTGGGWTELLYAQGEESAYDASKFKQITDASGGLSLVKHKPIVDITASTLAIISGSPSTVTLKWDSAYTTSTTLNGGIFSNQDVTANTFNGYGTITIPAPTATTTYTVTGTNTGAPDPTGTKSVTIYVDSPPVLTSLTVDDATILAGAPVTFRFTGLLGDTWTLSDGATNTDVTSVILGDRNVQQAGVFTLPVGPSVDTTFSLTATNSFGTSTAITVMVDVGDPPQITFTGDRANMLQGTWLKLDWAVTNAISQSITPRIVQASLSNAVPATGFSYEQPVRTTTWTLTATNIYGSRSENVTVTLPERFGISPAGWTVQVDFWNRLGYTDPLYGNRNALNQAVYQADEMFAIADADLGERGPLATANISATTSTMTGPAVPPTTQPGATNKVLMRYRQTGIMTLNYDDALVAGGYFPGGEVRPPPGATSVGGAGVTFDQYALKATANLVVNAPGHYTIGINNDDGGRLRVDLNQDGDFLDNGETIVQDETYHGLLAAAAPTVALSSTVELQAGIYAVEYVYFEGAGGSGGEVYMVDQADNCRIKHLPVVPTAYTGPATADVVISEFMAVNDKTLEDLEGSTPDWIELYNGSASAISLNGYYLTDNALVPNKWAFPASTSIPAGGYLIVYASSKANRVPPPPATELHTNFSLGGGSGYLSLKKDDGAGGYLDMSAFTYPNQRTDVSYGWYEGTNVGYSAAPTPGKPNLGGSASLVAGDTSFSVDRGIKSAPFDLTITTTDTTPGTVIRYTTDGSTPTWVNGQNYTAPITISTTTVVRAMAMRPGAVPTNLDTQTYIFPADVLGQNSVQAISRGWPASSVSGQNFDYGMDTAITAGNEAEVITALTAIPTVSVVTDMTNFTDPACGIFVESQFRGRAFERACSIELLNDKGNLLGDFQIEAGIRSRGGFSRNDANPKHSWHLYFRNDPGYGGRLGYPVFGSDGASRFAQLDLATANNYSWSYAPEASNLRTFSYTNNTNTTTVFNWRYNTFLRDIAARDVQINASGYGTRNKYVHVYLNGIYWGLHYIQERAEASYAEEYFGGDKDNYDVVKSTGSTNNYQTEATDGNYTRGITGTATADGTYASDWAKLYGGGWDLRVRNGIAMTTAAINDRNIRFYKLMGYDYNPTTQTATRNAAYPVLLDVNSLIDYIVITCYCGAYDAPLSTFLNNASNNWIGMRDRASEQGFRYMVWDFEHGMGSDMLSGDITRTAATSTTQDINLLSGVNNKFVYSPPGIGVVAGFRSTNRFGPWAWAEGGAAVGLNPRSIWPTNQAFRGAYSATNPEYYHNSETYNTGNDLARSNPQYLHEFLAFATEYRRMFADRANCLLRQNGPLTTANVLAAINKRELQLQNAVIAESARWGNAKGVALTNYNKAAWQAAVQNVKDWVTHGSNQHVLSALPIYEAGGVTPRVGTGVAGPGRAEVIISQLRGYKDGANTGGGLITVTNKALTTNVVTLTTGTNTFTVGQSIQVSIGDDVFDGTFTTTAVTGTTVSYAKTNGNVASAGVTRGLIWPTGIDVVGNYVVPNLFPSLDAPTLGQYTGVVPSGTQISLTNANATLANQTIYYTTDGQDPRPIGGGAPLGTALSIGPNGTATGNATLTATGLLVARVYDSVLQEWSALAKGEFVVGVTATSSNLVITEINYNPEDTTPAANDGQSFEFIELQNVSASNVDLSGVSFTTGISYSFALGTILPPGERIVIVKDLAAFNARYPVAAYPATSGHIYGPFTGGFDNGGEGLRLVGLDGPDGDALPDDIANFSYNDIDPWPLAPDGDGPTLVFTCASPTTADKSDGTNWFSHALKYGNPAGPDCGYASFATNNDVSTNGQADSDMDGLTDLIEYMLGTNPKNVDGSHDSSAHIPTTQVLYIDDLAADYQTITFTRANNSVDLTVTAQTSADLTNPSWQNNAVLVESVRNGEFTTYTYRAPLPISDVGRLFMRVHAEVTPTP